MAQIFDEAGVTALLIGDSAANTVYGFDSTLPMELDVMAAMVAAVRRGTKYALVVADMPFASYEESPEQAYRSAAKLMKAGAEAVKLEGGEPEITWNVGDAQRLPLPDACADAYVISFGIRNVTDIPGALREARALSGSGGTARAPRAPGRPRGSSAGCPGRGPRRVAPR